MRPFIWMDRRGQRHELDDPALIEVEAVALAQDMDGCVDMLGNPDRMIRDPARAAITTLQPELKRLSADLARWNDHAVAVTRAEAANLAEQIDTLPEMLADLLLVVELHGEHDRFVTITAGMPEMRARMLAEPMMTLQRTAIAACASRTAPPDTATRGEARAWLDEQPRFQRRDDVDGGWFAWNDRDGHAHRLVDPLAIEREVVTTASELAELRGSLTGATAADALYTAACAGAASWERLKILQGDLERYVSEATAREDAAWTAYAADWRSKRKMS